MSSESKPEYTPLESGQKDLPRFTPGHGPRAWVQTLWALIVHCILAIIIAALVICYDRHHFNLTEWRPLIPLADGSTVRSSQYNLRQSDVTTILSALLVLLRMILAGWAGSLCWRSAFLLMEKPGLQRQDLEWMISYKLLTPFSYFKDPLTFFVGLILPATILAAAASPILTGSITWTPSNQLVGVQDASINIATISNSNQWGGYTDYDLRRGYTSTQAIGNVVIAWGRDSEKGVLKRVVQSAAGLQINSTIASLTLPYFSVTALEWIADPMSLSEDQRSMSQVVPKLMTYGNANPLMTMIGTAALIPDVAWSKRPFPQPSIVSETRTLVLYTGWQDAGAPCGHNNSDISSTLPSTMGLYQEGATCFAFARVTYSAGVTECANCRISSALTVQPKDNTALEVKEDAMTTEALWLMPEIIGSLVLMNSSIPSSWGNVDDYVIELLGRSYSGAWTALTSYLSQNSTPSSFYPSIPALEARVNKPRVAIWLGTQLLATVCGVIFLLKQATAKYRLVGDTTLAAFDLDTSAVTGNKEKPMAEDVLRLESNGRGLKVVGANPR